MRKQSLHILKSTATRTKGKQHTSLLETISNETSSNSHGLTKKERWANKEAKSLGIESLCNNSVDSDSSSELKWGAFFLLYEMLEEYGTHLVEAAWNYQVHSPFCLYICRFFVSDTESSIFFLSAFNLRL